jgi:hypothetical protein
MEWLPWVYTNNTSISSKRGAYSSGLIWCRNFVWFGLKIRPGKLQTVLLPREQSWKARASRRLRPLWRLEVVIFVYLCFPTATQNPKFRILNWWDCWSGVYHPIGELHFDLKGYMPSLDTTDRFTLEDEAIERSEGAPDDDQGNNKSGNNKSEKIFKSGNPRPAAQKGEPGLKKPVYFCWG